MDSPTDTPRPPLAHQLSSAGNSPGNSPLPSRAASPAAAPQHPFFDYRAERAHLTDKGAFDTELPTALHPPVPPSTVAPVSGVTPSIDRLTLNNLSISNASTAPTSPEAPGRTRTRSESLMSSRAKGDLTSPRIANLGLTPSPDAVKTRRPSEESKTNGFIDHGPPKLNPELEDAEEIDEGFTARKFSFLQLDNGDAQLTPRLLQTLQRTRTKSSRQNCEPSIPPSKDASTCETSTWLYLDNDSKTTPPTTMVDSTRRLPLLTLQHPPSSRLSFLPTSNNGTFTLLLRHLIGKKCKTQNTTPSLSIRRILQSRSLRKRQ